MPRSDWRGELTIGEGWARWRGRAGDSTPHRHLAAQAVHAPDGVEVTDAAGRTSAGQWLLIDPLALHRLSPAAEVELLFIEPTSRGQAAAAARAHALEQAGRTATVLHARDPRLRFWSGAAPPADAADVRVTRGLAQIPRLIGEGRVPLARVAQASGLSAERFRHLFVASTGTSFRRYVLWRRLGTALAAIQAGQSATAAAHTAGFADSAHFARTLRGMFGVSAQQLAG